MKNKTLNINLSASQAGGFSLVELVVVVGIISILLSISTYLFSQHLRKSAIEKQIKTLYADMMELRSRSMFEKKSKGLRLATMGYSIYSSTTMTVTPAETKTLTSAISWNNPSADITFDTQGFINASLSSVCTDGANSAYFDSLVVSASRIRIGKLKEGMACATANIDPR